MSGVAIQRTTVPLLSCVTVNIPVIADLASPVMVTVCTSLSSLKALKLKVYPETLVAMVHSKVTGDPKKAVCLTG